MMIMKKRGSHVGVVLSFVVFVTFLIFLYSILEPAIQTRGDKQNLLDYLKTEIIEESLGELITATIVINESYFPPELCFEIEQISDKAFYIVKNQTGGITTSSSEGNKLKINWTNKENRFFKIYYSDEELNSYGLSEENCADADGNYSISYVRNNNYIFEDKIEELINYNKDDLRGLLDFPKEDDFWIGFEYEDGTIIKLEEPEVSTNIYAEEFPIQYIDRDANIKSGFINIKVW